jgi:predicted transcriptional regulator
MSKASESDATTALYPLTDVCDLMQAWIGAKHEEDEANKNRINIENLLISTLAFNKREGSETKKFDDLKITFTAKLNRTVDVDKWLEIKAQVPENLQAVVEEKVTYKVTDKGARWLEENNRDVYALVSKAITTKPAKVAVKVEVI